VPELPEVQAHAERLTAALRGAVLRRFTPFNFTALKTAVPRPDVAYGSPLVDVGRRGKYLLVRFEPAVFVVHLMQGGRLLADDKKSAKPRNGQARFEFDDGPALLLTEAGKERRAGVWCVDPAALDGPPLDRLGPDALEISLPGLAAGFRAHNGRVHGWLRDQHHLAGIGRMLANEICHRAKVTPFAMTASMDDAAIAAVHAAIHTCIDDALAHERTLDAMSSSADRPGAVHGRIGAACPVCGDTIRSVSYSSYTVAYCPTCQTAGKVLADNTTSKFLR
jgi:formamidopyrimidine-DNA glycosylase